MQGISLSLRKRDQVRVLEHTETLKQLCLKAQEDPCVCASRYGSKQKRDLSGMTV